MAVMIPDDVEDFCTDGERHFYGFLKAVAKPDSRYLVWYLPDINGHEPDFILFCKDTGLIIFEVKDWVLDQIQQANPQHFTLTINGRNEERESPLRQAKTYCHSLMDKIRADRRLVSKEPHHAGNPKIPIHEGVVSPISTNMNTSAKPSIRSLTRIESFSGTTCTRNQTSAVTRPARPFSKPCNRNTLPPFTLT